MIYSITTPLYYVNDKPHLGSTYTTIACDAISRFMKLEGKSVVFVTGVDEHGLKIQRTALENSITPKEHCDKIAASYPELWKLWNITNDTFIRTSNGFHKEVVNQFFAKVQEADDIYIGKQKGWYCVGCEEFKDTLENDNSPECPIHQRNLEWRDEENLFFRLSKYQKNIEELVSQTDFIKPISRKKEVINFVAKGLRDFSISRVNVSWGIPVPGYNGHTFYVWFDALVGYLSALLKHYNEKDLTFLERCGWPIDIHIIGKDILRFHAVYWPAMLMSANINPPKKIFGHGFLTREGKKMGKSLGNILDPAELVSDYDADSLRWFLLKDFKFGSDGDYQQKRFIEIVNNDLANTIGNLLNRTSNMSRKWFNNKVPTLTTNNNSNNSLSSQSLLTIDKYIKYMYELDFQAAAEHIILLSAAANTYLNDKAPWKLIKEPQNAEEVSTDIYSVLETVRIVALLIYPFTPLLSERISKQLNQDVTNINWRKRLKWGLLKQGIPLPEPEPVFLKLE